jgi:hypothetical protein
MQDEGSICDPTPLTLINQLGYECSPVSIHLSLKETNIEALHTPDLLEQCY